MIVKNSNPSIETLPISLQTIVNQLSQNRELKPYHVIQAIREAQVEPIDLQPWADYDHPVADSYGRKLVYKAPNFEIMVMSWKPGDFSTIHDHGYTQWGAVQIFGPAEHATFRVEDDTLKTLSRQQVDPYDIVGVSHSLIHQMGNPTSDTHFLSLHIYGELEDIDSVTGDARIFDPKGAAIQRVDGGVFFALPSEQIKRTEPGPGADFPTWLRHMTELVRRLRKMDKAGQTHAEYDTLSVQNELFHQKNRDVLLDDLRQHIDKEGHQANSIYWRIINHELKEAAKLQREIHDEQVGEDAFHKYAELYDALIGRPCLHGFMANYLRFFKQKYGLDFSSQHIISLGCGTGLVETFMMEELGADHDKMYGIDVSKAMVSEAKRRIRADEGDILTLDPDIKMWDMVFSGLNVFHYLDYTRLEEAIQKTAAIIKPGGYFIGDFITPDHIRWYPNLMYSENKDVISLRTPRLIESEGRMFQESEIINISYLEGSMEINYAGKHRRFLPPMHRIRTYFEKAFGGQVDLYDAHSLELIPDWADSCKSTRYIVVARKKK